MTTSQEGKPSASASVANSEPIFTISDDYEIPYSILNSALSRLSAIMDKPLSVKEKETFPTIKQKKEHVEFLLKETLLSRTEVEGLLTRASGDLSTAVKMYLDSPMDKSFKF